MVRAIMMTDEQIAELIDLARKDPVLWQQLKERELEIERIIAAAAEQGKWPDDDDLVIDPPPLEPSLSELVNDLFKRTYGPNENFDHAIPTVDIRRALRIELGLPVE